MRVIELANTIKAFELNLTNRYLTLNTSGFSDEGERRALQQEYAEITLGRNHLEWISDGGDTPKYFPSLYVVFPAERSPIAEARIADAQLHQAFLLGSDVVAKNLYIGKYQGLTRSSNSKTLMLSLRGLDCRTSITHDQAVAACRANGATHHCTTQAEYAYLALRCKADGFQPQGNNLFGKDEQGNYGDTVHQYTLGTTKYFGRVAQGSGPLSWNHDGSPLGVWGLNGNVWEWCSGFRLNGGEINILPLNTAALATADLSAASAEWRGVLSDGALCAPGATGALKFGSVAAENTITLSSQTIASGYYYGQFKNLDYTPQPTILKELSILPCDGGDYGGDYIYISTDGERAAFRGGYWNNGSINGLSALYLLSARSYSDFSVGARGSFYRTAA